MRKWRPSKINAKSSSASTSSGGIAAAKWWYRSAVHLTNECSHADNLGVRRTKIMTTKNPAPKTKSERKLNDEKTRDSYYQRVMKKQDAYEKWRGFFEPKRRPCI